MVYRRFELQLFEELGRRQRAKPNLQQATAGRQLLFVGLDSARLRPDGRLRFDQHFLFDEQARDLFRALDLLAYRQEDHPGKLFFGLRTFAGSPYSGVSRGTPEGTVTG